MKKITFLILVLVVCACKKEDSNTAIPAPPPMQSLPATNFIYSSKSLEKHIKFNSELSQYELVQLENPQSFSITELNFPVKENEFEYNKSKDFKFYTPFNFEKDKIEYKVITYHSYGENDTKVLNVQLNSYSDGKPIDALLLDCRFVFETEYYREFSIKEDGTILIKKVTINGLNYDDDGNIIGTKAVKDTTTENLNYKLNSTGSFTKI
ncbi:hypothetical protein [Flavobacterium sp.]|uniref:hypothetical protein n=1 Tax=Flavobacterium sp. TaxID=239 RepID=UPI00260EFC41|nr:hypothetical protein [Flavobacterium sp.]MDG2432706.1 hypothetical protein [Flavobacterium sp.]